METLSLWHRKAELEKSSDCRMRSLLWSEAATGNDQSIPSAATEALKNTRHKTYISACRQIDTATDIIIF